MLILPSAPTTMVLPTYYKLGKTKAEVSINNAEENRNAAISLVSQARHTINIFTQELDAALYDNKEFEKHIFELATRHRSVEIRILVQDSTRAIQNSHRLIRLAQKLTSSIFIKKPAIKFKDVQSAFMTVDGVGMLYRIQGGNRNYDASVNFMSPQRTGKLDNFFIEVWEHSDTDPQVRRLFM
jgi:hypothetical protein